MEFSTDSECQEDNPRAKLAFCNKVLDRVKCPSGRKWKTLLMRSKLESSRPGFLELMSLSARSPQPRVSPKETKGLISLTGELNQHFLQRRELTRPVAYPSPPPPLRSGGGGHCSGRSGWEAGGKARCPGRPGPAAERAFTAAALLPGAVCLFRAGTPVSGRRAEGPPRKSVLLLSTRYPRANSQS